MLFRSPILDPATRSGAVQVEIPNPDGQLKAEMSARIQMETGTQRQALLVPREAIVMRGDQPGVHLLDGDRARFQPVETGISSGGDVEIVGGLSLNQKVITRGTQGLQDGSPVILQEPDGGAGNPAGMRGPSAAGQTSWSQKPEGAAADSAAAGGRRGGRP